MRIPLIAAGLIGAGLIGAGLIGAGLTAWPLAAAAEDHEAGVPLTPAEAAGAWTVESQGRTICTVTLSAGKADSGYGAKAAGCGQAIPGAPVAWRPTSDGMALVGADGTTLIAFNRWSNSLFVSHRGSGADIQLRRGSPPS